MTAAPMLFAPLALLIGNGSGISHTAFCPRDFAVALASASSPVPFACLHCRSGFSSLGGVSRDCVQCNGMVCAPRGQHRFNTTVNAYGIGLQTADSVKLRMDAYSSTKGGALQGRAESNVWTVDFTPPAGGWVVDAEVCKARSWTLPV